MKFSWKGLATAIILASLVFLNMFIGLYVYANIINWKIDLLNINPSETSNMRNFPIMTYPPSGSTGFEIGDWNTTILFEHFSLKYNGTAAENKPLEMTVIGTVAPEFAQKIHSVSLYFDGALPYPVGSGTFSGGWGITLYPTIEETHADISFGAFLVGNPVVICWQVEGDYYPSIRINFKNFTTIPQDYSSYKNFGMHINSATIIEQENSNRINTSIAIATVFFLLIDGFTLVGRYFLTSKKKRRTRVKKS